MRFDYSRWQGPSPGDLAFIRQLMLFLTAGSIALFSGATVLGWSLVWLVVALAALNAFGGFCVGCAVYYWLSRLHFTWFQQTAARRDPPRHKAQSRSKYMSSDILLRSALAVVIIIAGVLAYWWINQRLLVRARNNLSGQYPALQKKPVNVYFNTPDCTPCKTVQRPAIQKVANVLGERLRSLRSTPPSGLIWQRAGA